jgi:hypothetical protein
MQALPRLVRLLQSRLCEPPQAARQSPPGEKEIAPLASERTLPFGRFAMTGDQASSDFATALAACLGLGGGKAQPGRYESSLQRVPAQSARGRKKGAAQRWQCKSRDRTSMSIPVSYIQCDDLQWLSAVLPGPTHNGDFCPGFCKAHFSDAQICLPYVLVTRQLLAGAL